MYEFTTILLLSSGVGNEALTTLVAPRSKAIVMPKRSVMALVVHVGSAEADTRYWAYRLHPFSALPVEKRRKVGAYMFLLGRHGYERSSFKQQIAVALVSPLALCAVSCSFVNSPPEPHALGGGEPSSSSPGSGGSDVASAPCAVAADCSHMNTGCVVGECSDLGSCEAKLLVDGQPCGDPTLSPCDRPDTCDHNGQCQLNKIPDGQACEGCLGGADCRCALGVCVDCAANNFENPESVDNWTLTGGWNVYGGAPQTLTEPVAVNFLPTERGKVLGTDGNRVTPYPGQETEESSARSPMTLIPQVLTFLSWHIDEGSMSRAGLFPDNKVIRVSLDGGQNWDVLVDCAYGPLQTLPFCSYVQQRTADQWDTIEIDMQAYANQPGIIEFRYDSVDECCGFERGWFIDLIHVPCPN